MAQSGLWPVSQQNDYKGQTEQCSDHVLIMMSKSRAWQSAFVFVSSGGTQATSGVSQVVRELFANTALGYR